MASVKDIKLRVRAVKNTQQITKAMKMVAAARIKRAEAKVKSSRPYTEKMRKMVEEVVGLSEEPNPFFIAKTAAKKTALLLVTADKGLCGAYNANLIRVTQQFLNQNQNREIHLLTVGNKGRSFFSKRNINISNSFQISFYPEFHEAQNIAELLMKNFVDGIWDEIHIIYSQFISAMHQKPQQIQLLPLSAESSRNKREFLFEPDPESVLKSLLPKFISVLIYNVLLEARASELGARLVAMGNATDNAKKLIDALTLQFYRARQESITREILEVASGSEALKG
jgi:F-type H+-transporting ATPase subunit gamma